MARLEDSTWKVVLCLLATVAGICLLLYLTDLAFGADRLTDEEQGRQLFNDPRLSANGKVSCATCHREDKGFTAGALPPALDGGTLALKAPTVWNASGAKHLFWDGRATTLEEQAVGPLTNPREMGNKSVADAARRVGLTEKELVRRLVAYERSLTPGPGRLDEWINGESDFLTAAEKRGWNLFRGKAECYKCHDPKNGFKDDDFHNTGIGYTVVSKDTPLQIDDALFADMDERAGFAGGYFKEWGRANVTLTKKDMGKFKTPSLKKVKFCGPYMHDCSLGSLEKVVGFYNEGGRPNAVLDKKIHPLKLSRQEEADLVAFLKVL